MGIQDFTDNTIEKVVSYASDNREKVVKTLINFLLLLVIFIVTGCFDFLHLTFRFDYLKEVSYWTKTAMKAVNGICAFHIGVNLTFDKEVKKDFDLNRLSQEYVTKNKLKDQISFDYYITNVFNRNEKKKAYIDTINVKIHRVVKYASDKSKLLYYSAGNTEEEKEKIAQLKSKNKFCNKMERLNKLKSEDYVDNNIDNIRVKYSKVDPILFELEVDGGGRYKGTKIQGSVTSGKIKRTGTLVLSMLLVSLVVTSIGTQINAGELEEEIKNAWFYVLTIGTDLAVLCWQAIQGAFYSRKLICNEMTLPLANRIKILDSYFDWSLKEENKDFVKDNSKIKQIYSLLEKGV